MLPGRDIKEKLVILKKYDFEGKKLSSNGLEERKEEVKKPVQKPVLIIVVSAADSYLLLSLRIEKLEKNQ